MRVHSIDAEATKLRQGSVLTSGQVADGVVRDIRETRFTFASADDEEAVAGGLYTREGATGVKSSDGMELVGGGDPCPLVQRHDV